MKRAPYIKIVGGDFKGLKIFFKPSKLTRPTSNKSRETLFNWLMHDIKGSTCLDMFAGTGALGIEALSRGASFVCFIEKNKKLCFEISKTLERLRLQKKTIVINTNSLRMLVNKGSKLNYDIIFLDPPYKEKLVEKALIKLQQSRMLNKDSLIYVETQKKDDSYKKLINVRNIKSKFKGQTCFNLIKIDDL